MFYNYIALFVEMLAKCLLECYKESVKAGSPLALRVFVSGRGRLENEGATALAEAFKVGHQNDDYKLTM